MGAEQPFNVLVEMNKKVLITDVDAVCPNEAMEKASEIPGVKRVIDARYCYTPDGDIDEDYEDDWDYDDTQGYDN